MQFDPDTADKLLATGSGSAIAAWIARATGWNLIFMLLAGVSTAWVLTPSLADWFNVHKHEGALGFVVGFLGLLALRKLYVAVESISGESLGSVILNWIKRLFGG